MSCDVGKAAEGLENELWRRWSYVRFGEWGGSLPTSQLILQPFRCFTYVIGTSPTSPGEPPMSLWWCLTYPWWFCNLQWLRPAYERCKLALELKMFKTPALSYNSVSGNMIICLHLSMKCPVSRKMDSIIAYHNWWEGEGWLGFPDLWSAQKLWRNWYLTPVVNFSVVRRAQLAKFTLLTFTLIPLRSFHIF